MARRPPYSLRACPRWLACSLLLLSGCQPHPEPPGALPTTRAMDGGPRAPRPSFSPPATAGTERPPIRPASAPSATDGSAAVPVAPAAATDGPPLERVRLETGGSSAGEDRPLVVALHGLGDRPESFAAAFRELALPASFVVPRAPLAWHDGHAWFPIDLWRLDAEELAPRIVASAGRVARSIERWREEARVGPVAPPKPIVVGYSQGGMIALYLALARPDLVEQAIVVAAWLPASLVPSGDPPPAAPRIVAIHGEDDRVVPLGPTRQLVGELARRGYPIELRPYPSAGHRFVAETRRGMLDAIRSALRPPEH